MRWVADELRAGPGGSRAYEQTYILGFGYDELCVRAKRPDDPAAQALRQRAREFAAG